MKILLPGRNGCLVSKLQGLSQSVPTVSCGPQASEGERPPEEAVATCPQDSLSCQPSGGSEPHLFSHT